MHLRRYPQSVHTLGMIRRAMRLFIAVVVMSACTLPAQAQYLNRVKIERVNRRLAGQLIDYTKNHRDDRRIYSSILGMPRDLYVYLPPGYNPACTYPLVLFFHMADVDEHYFAGSNLLHEVDDLIVHGKFPPAVLACPDGTYKGWNRLNAKHSFYVNGLGGQFEDHIVQEVIPFLTTNYSIRPERQAHATLGFSAGGYGAMALAIRHRDYFGAVATLAGPLNLRYFNSDRVYAEDFDPATYRWRTDYDPRQVVGVFYRGLLKVRARKFMTSVFGDGNVVVSRIMLTNPADLIVSTDIQPGELAIYAHYPGRDNFNFDAQVQSFQWLAAQKGIDVTVACDPKGTHSLAYFRANTRPVLLWLSRHLLAPAAAAPEATASLSPQRK
jgi:S-formylglutathione hydrolase FrmB